jgi:hypothetical protein
VPKFVIERIIDGIGQSSENQLQTASQRSCRVLYGLGPEIQWIQSFVTRDKMYCVYLAPDEDLIRRHAVLGGFPITQISRIRSEIGPVTAE